MSFLLPMEITSKEVWQNAIDFLFIEITSRRGHHKDVDCLSIVITLNKMRQNEVHFWPIETTLKKYVKMSPKFVDISYSTFRRNIDIELTLIRRVMSVGLCDSMTSQ